MSDDRPCILLHAGNVFYYVVNKFFNFYSNDILVR